MTISAELRSWAPSATRDAVTSFVTAVATPGDAAFVPPEERVAVFDNDGTLWTEKPMMVELGFVLERLAAMAANDPELRERQPWKAAYENDHGWLGNVVTEHYTGHDDGVKVLLGGLVRAFAGMSVDEYTTRATEYLGRARHPQFGRLQRDCSYLPMVELLRYLEAHGFTTYIASGGDRDFMRPISTSVYGVPPERVIGSSTALRYDPAAASVAYAAEPDVFDDGPAKPVRIWSRIGRRPILAAGNSNGDIPMLDYAGGTRPALCLLIDHDDEEREVAYKAGAEKALERARSQDWAVVSMRTDWTTVFGPGQE